MSSRVQMAAARLCAVRQQRIPLESLPAELKPLDESDAYAIQDALHPCLASAGRGALVGYKIGCTTRVMQQYLEIPNPCAGGILASSVQHQLGQFAHADFVRVGVECEIAVRLANDLGVTPAPVDRVAAATAIGACMAAIEIVDDRYREYRALGAPTLIADDFFGAGCVLGQAVAGMDPRELASTRAVMHIDGAQVGSGVGTDILGEPLDALVWLSNNLVRRGRHLRKDDFVLLGSLVQTQWVTAGQSITIENDRLGAVRAEFY